MSPLLYSRYPHNCVATFETNITIKFAVDIAVVGLNTDNHEKAYLKVDFGKKQRRNYAPLDINRSLVERVDSFKYLGANITEGLTWARHTDSV